MDRGQGYYLYNKVDTIEQRFQNYKELVPKPLLGLSMDRWSEVRYWKYDGLHWSEYDILVQQPLLKQGKTF